MKQLLLVNGWSASARFWQGLVAHLPVDWTARIIDLDCARSLDSWLEVIDREVTPETLLVGWSLGGALALKYAASTHKSFSGLCTLQSNPCFVAQADWPHGMNEIDFEQFYELVEGDRRAELVQRFSHLMTAGSESYKTDKRALKKQYSGAALPENKALLSGLDLLRELDVRAELPLISMPCLHVFGRVDALVPCVLEAEVQSIVPNHRTITIQGMGHLPCFGYGAIVSALLLEFAVNHDR